MTRDNLQALYYLLYRQTTTNTDLSAANFLILLNLAYQNTVADAYPTVIDGSATVTVPYTTMVTRTSATSLVLTSVTGFVAGQEICVNDGSYYNYATIQSVTVGTNTLTLVSPGILHVFVSGAIVTPVALAVSASRCISNVNYHIYTVSANTSSEVLAVSPDDMVRLGSTQTVSGTPSKYAILTNTQMKLYPVPSAAGYLEIRYKNKTEYTLAETTSEPIVDEDLQIAMVYWCLMHSFIRNREWDDAKAMNQIYWSVINRTRAEESELKANWTNIDFKRSSLSE